MKRLVAFYNKLEEYLLVGSLAFSITILFLQVIMRSVFNNSLSWTEELARYLFIWQIWLGTSIALRENQHIKVELLFSFVKSERARRTVDLLALAVWLAFCVVMLFNSVQLIVSMVNRNVLSPAMRIPLSLVYLSFPAGLLTVSLRLLGNVVQLFRSGRRNAGPEGGEGHGNPSGIS